ncbi:conserved conserved hypothetical protein [Candidatus Photodesmus katoptron]|uniref:Phosphoribosyl-ATP pyrophosphohydrolase n=1 Tax=Candidatus Photodesmus katoptron Akat1 TaxID=1236703 RepID=S3DI75_9GAMM|nr:nucleoside triphosphate pyrophosphohydrolase family protein [Candidatus Photodesmus katoptron]EPE37400.1 hypothetical protein O1U_0700 [Candidatus Photodesmus katoptron Akat1]KEY90807.1 conserved conserved hypothetical protein [Candidatus Photodesmus katoptron]
MELSKLNQNIFDHLYLDIIEFRKTFDLPVSKPLTLDEKSDKLHNSLAIEELTELAQAENKIEQADAIIDIVYVLVGRLVHLGQSKIKDNLTINYLIDLLLSVSINLGIQFLPCWNEVHLSNMSKACRNKKEYLDTKAFYKKQGIKLIGIPKDNYIIAKCSEDFIKNNQIILKNKIIKSIYYHPANLASIIQK